MSSALIIGFYFHLCYVYMMLHSPNNNIQEMQLFLYYILDSVCPYARTRESGDFDQAPLVIINRRLSQRLKRFVTSRF